MRIYTALVEQWPNGAETGRLVPQDDDFNERVAVACSGADDGGTADADDAVTAEDVERVVAEYTLSQFMVGWLRGREANGQGLPSTQPELATMLQEGGTHAMGPKVMKRVAPLFQSRGSGARMASEHRRRMKNVKARPASGRKTRRW